jgi:GT2 family glycosyltransferase
MPSVHTATTAPPPISPRILHHRIADAVHALRDTSPTISVIVPVHNGGAAFSTCIEAVLAALGPRDELIVVADGESDGAWRCVPHGRARVLLNLETRGPAAARNRGARFATGDVLFFVDADVVLPVDALVRVRTAFASGSEVDAVIGSYDDTPGHPDFLSQYRNLLHHHTHQTACQKATTFWGACGAVRRDAFETVGGFDESYERPCVEDIELGYRLTAAGFRIQLKKDLQVKHLKAWSARSITRTDLLSRAIPWTQLLLHRKTIENDLNVCVSSRLSVISVWGLPLAAAVSFWAPGTALMLAVALAAFVLLLNASFYRFLLSKRGVAFTLRAIPWHAYYFAYSGLGFAVGAARYALRSSRGSICHPQLRSVSQSSPCQVSPLSSSAPVQPG